MSAARESLLRKVLYDIAKERNYDNPEFQVTALPPTGQNFTSQLFHVTISAPERENLKLFAKVSIVAEAFRKEVPSKIFVIEQHVYTKLLKSYKEIEDKHNVPAEHRLVVPKYYGCNDTYLEEVLVLQDLTADGFTTFNRLKSIDWEYASKAVEEMAKMHALSIAYQKEYPEDYEEAIKVLTREMTESPQLVAAMQQVVVKVLESVKEENRGKLMKFLLEGFDPSKFQEFYRPRRRPVIIHSDFRQSNLMHKRREDGALQVVIVDYQTMHSGCVALDLIYFILTGSDGAFRKEHYADLIEHYFTTITAALKRLALNPEEVFPREDFDQDLNEMLPFGLIVSGMMLPMITLDMANLPESGENESIEGMMEMLSNTNELCARLLNEVVDDYVAWGVL